MGEDGSFYPHVPLFAGKRVLQPDGKTGDADPAVIAALQEAGALLAQGKLTHSYPHSWRSKAPLIFRNTPQWFISMETNDLRKKALEAIDDTRFVPPQGRNRLYSMIEQRPDWCVSRQRAWGVPIAVFVEQEDRRAAARPDGHRAHRRGLRDGGRRCLVQQPAVALPRQRLRPRRLRAGEGHRRGLVRVRLDPRLRAGAAPDTDLAWPADLYLEGSDQHRGWFHSSLLESCGTRGRAPYEAVLTHGFTLDEQGRKMSKSLGNVVAPQDVMKQHGADILRCGSVSSDYVEDQHIGPKILKANAESYRRLRNTLRYLLGALDGFEAKERIEPAQMPELERWVLHRLAELDETVRRAVDEFDFGTLFTALHNFCAVDLSAFYFDIRKDALYCDRPDDPRRRAARTVFDQLFNCLTAWLAPILCFTAEEAWQFRHGRSEAEAWTDSVHLRVFPEVPQSWRDEALAAKWNKVRDLRRVVTGALELERASKRIGASLQAHPTVFADGAYIEALQGIDLAEIAITSAATLQHGRAAGRRLRAARRAGRRRRGRAGERREVRALLARAAGRRQPGRSPGPLRPLRRRRRWPRGRGVGDGRWKFFLCSNKVTHGHPPIPFPRPLWAGGRGRGLAPAGAHDLFVIDRHDGNSSHPIMINSRRAAARKPRPLPPAHKGRGNVLFGWRLSPCSAWDCRLPPSWSRWTSSASGGSGSWSWSRRATSR